MMEEDIKLKAKELFDKVDSVVSGDINLRNQKDMAQLIANEIINELDDLEKNYSGQINNSWGQDDWIKVKGEIDKL